MYHRYNVLRNGKYIGEVEALTIGEALEIARHDFTFAPTDVLAVGLRTY